MQELLFFSFLSAEHKTETESVDFHVKQLENGQWREINYYFLKVEGCFKPNWGEFGTHEKLYPVLSL